MLRLVELAVHIGIYTGVMLMSAGIWLWLHAGNGYKRSKIGRDLACGAALLIAASISVLAIGV
ncbi:MAG: hypothetical protein QXW10_00100 [Candidatus Micrarchaeaceae archaeon]